MSDNSVLIRAGARMRSPKGILKIELPSRNQQTITAWYEVEEGTGDGLEVYLSYISDRGRRDAKLQPGLKSLLNIRKGTASSPTAYVKNNTSEAVEVRVYVQYE